MTKCRFWENRYLPIEYSLENMQSTEGYFSLCLIKRGNAVVSIDGIKCYLSAPALLCLNPDRKAEIIRSAKLQMKTIFFAPEFINRNLSVERITADDYELNCRLFDFPSFDLFYQTDDTFNCIIPFESEELGKVEFLFDSIIEQLSVQPDQSLRRIVWRESGKRYACGLYSHIYRIQSREAIHYRMAQP